MAYLNEGGNCMQGYLRGVAGFKKELETSGIARARGLKGDRHWTVD